MFTFTSLEIRILPPTAQGYPVQLVEDEKRHLAQGISPLEFQLHEESDTMEKVGQRLFTWLCHDQAIALAWAQLGDQPRCIRLNIQAAEVAAWPWESLRENLPHSAPMPFAASDHTPLSRYCETKHSVKRAKNVSTVVVLVAIAAPENVADYRLAEIDAAKEEAAIRVAFAELGQVELHFVAAPVTLAALEQDIFRHQPDILQVVAHGNYNNKKQYATLCLANEHNDVAWVSETEWAAMLQRQMTSLPDLVFLSVCESGERAQRGLATALMQTAGVPTVLAMQGFISMNSARAFSQRFYQRLLVHGQVDLACNEARSHLLSLGAWDSYLAKQPHPPHSAGGRLIGGCWGERDKIFAFLHTLHGFSCIIVIIEVCKSSIFLLLYAIRCRFYYSMGL